MRHKLSKTLVASALGMALLSGFTTPASAADTTATFTVSGGALSIAAPASKALGSGAIAGTVAAVQLGDVTVTDARGALAGAWTATVSSTDFSTTGEGAPAIAKANADYWSGAATTSGTATFLPGQLLAANKVTLAAARTAYSASAIVGNNSATWNPTMSVTIPAAAVAGSYTGTITHSVA